MSTRKTPKIPLPKDWHRHVRSAVLNVISLAQYATVYTRSWAVDSMNGRVRLKSEMMPQVHVATATTAGKCVSGAGKSACMRRTEVISCLCCCRCGSPGSFYPAAVARCTATGIKRCICNQTWVRGYGFVAKPVGPPEPLPALRAYTSFWSWLRNVEWSMSFLFHQTTGFGTNKSLHRWELRNLLLQG